MYKITVRDDECGAKIDTFTCTLSELVALIRQAHTIVNGLDGSVLLYNDGKQYSIIEV